MQQLVPTTVRFLGRFPRTERKIILDCKSASSLPCVLGTGVVPSRGALCRCFKEISRYAGWSKIAAGHLVVTRASSRLSMLCRTAWRGFRAGQAKKAAGLLVSQATCVATLTCRRCHAVPDWRRGIQNCMLRSSTSHVEHQKADNFSWCLGRLH